MDFEGDLRILTASPSINSFLVDLSGLFDNGVLLLALIGVVNFGNVLEDRVRGSGDDSELPPTHPSTIEVVSIAITSSCANDDSQWLISFAAFVGNFATGFSEFEHGQNGG